jgi:hypothetical protein
MRQLRGPEGLVSNRGDGFLYLDEVLLVDTDTPDVIVGVFGSSFASSKKMSFIGLQRF